jgi:hypothetical protein
MATVRMRHPDVADEYNADEAQIPHLRAAGWDVVPTDPNAPDDTLDDLTVAELRDVARGRELPVSGTRAELLERLRGPAVEEAPAPSEAAEPSSEEGEE